VPIILATQEAEIRRLPVQNQQIVHATLSRTNPSQKTGGVAQGVGPEFKPQYHKNKSTKNKCTILNVCYYKKHCSCFYNNLFIIHPDFQV
jgi:hypothetical protein